MTTLPKEGEKLEEKKGESREEMVERGMKEKGAFSKVDSSRFELLQVQVWKLLESGGGGEEEGEREGKRKEKKRKEKKRKEKKRKEKKRKEKKRKEKKRKEKKRKEREREGKGKEKKRKEKKEKRKEKKRKEKKKEKKKKKKKKKKKTSPIRIYFSSFYIHFFLPPPFLNLFHQAISRHGMRTPVTPIPHIRNVTWNCVPTEEDKHVRVSTSLEFVCIFFIFFLFLFYFILFYFIFFYFFFFYFIIIIIIFSLPLSFFFL